MQAVTFGGDVAAESHDELVSFAQGELGRGLRGPAVALGPQLGQLPAQVPAGQGRHQDGVGLARPPLEDEGDGVAARRLLQLLCQGGEAAGLQRGEETQQQQPAETRRQISLNRVASTLPRRRCYTSITPEKPVLDKGIQLK